MTIERVPRATCQGEGALFVCHHIYIYICIYLYVYVYVYMCISYFYIYIYTYIYQKRLGAKLMLGPTWHPPGSFATTTGSSFSCNLSIIKQNKGRRPPGTLATPCGCLFSYTLCITITQTRGRHPPGTLSTPCGCFVSVFFVYYNNTKPRPAPSRHPRDTLRLSRVRILCLL